MDDDDDSGGDFEGDVVRLVTVSLLLSVVEVEVLFKLKRWRKLVIVAGSSDELQVLSIIVCIYNKSSSKSQFTTGMLDLLDMMKMITVGTSAAV